MTNKVLSICIPTYNRKDVLLAEVKEYLSLNDSRFSIVVQDNCSTDGTREEVRAIQDGRLVYRRNELNLGPLPNAIKSLSENDSAYLLFTIDKDLVNINELSNFIDYLEHKEPNFGYVDLSNNKSRQIIDISKGMKSLEKTAYLSKHPSGYFWKRDLFENEICQSYFQGIDPKFDFPFEIINAHLSVRYGATIVVMPLIINANMRGLTGKTLSYNESNIYYSCFKRLEAFQLYLSDFLTLDVPLQEKEVFATTLFKRTLGQVTVSLKRILRHKSLCHHYGLTPRIVSTREMFKNMRQTQRLFNRIATPVLGRKVVMRLSIRCIFRNVLSVCKHQLLELFVKPKDFEVKC